MALSTVPKQEKNYSGHLGLIVDSLSHKRPNVSATMQGLQGFIDTSALQWHEKTAKKLKARLMRMLMLVLMGI
ncbi:MULTISPECIES: hypothetical protein [unclassified Vibrio]